MTDVKDREELINKLTDVKDREEIINKLTDVKDTEELINKQTEEQREEKSFKIWFWFEASALFLRKWGFNVECECEMPFDEKRLRCHFKKPDAVSVSVSNLLWET